MTCNHDQKGIPFDGLADIDWPDVESLGLGCFCLFVSGTDAFRWKNDSDEKFKD